MIEDIPAVRGVHLLGGLRALDDGEQEISIGIDGQPANLTLQRPPYPALYQTLLKAGFQPVGVELVSFNSQLNGEEPVEWEAWHAGSGFKLMDARHSWANVRVDQARKGDTAVSDIAGRVATYLALLNIRLRHLSNAYHANLRSNILTENPLESGLVSNLFMIEIEAALHAFFADAGSFRDILAQACWKLVLKKSGFAVKTMPAFLKRAADSSNPIAQAIIAAGRQGGWIKNLTDIRNGIIHAAPLSKSQEDSYCDQRFMELDGNKRIPILHFPLAHGDWSIRIPVGRATDYNDVDAIKRSREDYRSFVATSGDGLDYAWRTVSNLVVLAESIRRAAGLKAPVPVITPIGPVKIVSQ